MDFGLVSLESLVGSETTNNGAQASQVGDSETNKPKGLLGSGFSKQERSGPGEDDWKSSKVAKTVDLSSASKTMPLHQGTPLLRSNSLFHGETHQQEHMLSFSSHKSEVSFLGKDGGILERTTQNSAFPYYQRAPPSYSRNADGVLGKSETDKQRFSGYGSGSLNASMHAPFTGVRGPFTPSQWIELQHQALIYKYISSNVPVPSNLLMPLKKSLNPYGLSGCPAVSLPPSTLGWGPFHLGFADNSDPEPGRCRRTDGKKWRCSRDAVADQKYCERHINRGRHRSRKPVEGQTGHAASGTTNSKVAPMTTSVSTSSAAMPGGGGTSNSLAIAQQELKGLHSGAAASSPSTDALVNRMQDLRGGLSVVSSSNINLKSNNESTFNILKQEIPTGDSSQSEFGLVSTDSLLNPTQESSYINPKSYASFLDFSGQETQDQHHPLRHFIDDWPKDHTNRSVITWPEEMKSDWTQLSMSIPMTSSEFSSTSNSPTRQEKLELSPLRLSREFEPMQMNLGVNNNNDLTEATQKQTNWVPISWGSSLGGPLGEVLTNTAGTVKACKNPSSLNLLTEGWDGSPHSQLGSSPTGVLQKSTFCSLSNSSSGSSPRADNKRTIDGASVFDDVLGSTLASSSVPSL